MKDQSSASDAASYLTLPVVLKFIGVMISIACVGIATYDIITNVHHLAIGSAAVVSNEEWSKLFGILRKITKPLIDVEHKFVDQLTCRVVFLIVTAIFMIMSLIQLIWFPRILFAGQLKSRILSGVIYHVIGFTLHLTASLFLMSKINELGLHFYNVDMMKQLGIIGLVNAGLYLLSAILALFSLLRDATLRSSSSLENMRLPIVASPPKYNG